LRAQLRAKREQGVAEQDPGLSIFLRIAHVFIFFLVGDEENNYDVAIFCTHVEIATPP